MGMIALAGATIVSLIAYDMAVGYELSEIREFLIACVFLAYGLWLLRRQAEAGSVAATQAG